MDRSGILDFHEFHDLWNPWALVRLRALTNQTLHRNHTDTQTMSGDLLTDTRQETSAGIGTLRRKGGRNDVFVYDPCMIHYVLFRRVLGNLHTLLGLSWKAPFV